MDAVTLLAQAAVVGLKVTLAGGRLEVTGRNTPEVAALVEELAQHKAEVVARLCDPVVEPLPKSLFSREDDIAASHQRMADQLRRAGYDEAAVAIFLKRINRC